jgi:hypothetical protein
VGKTLSFEGGNKPCPEFLKINLYAENNLFQDAKKTKSYLIYF